MLPLPGGGLAYTKASLRGMGVPTIVGSTLAWPKAGRRVAAGGQAPVLDKASGLSPLRDYVGVRRVCMGAVEGGQVPSRRMHAIPTFPA